MVVEPRGAESERTLREGVQALIDGYEGATLQGVAGGIEEGCEVRSRSSGHAAVWQEVASYLREHLRCSVLSLDLARTLQDLIECLTQCELDEEEEAKAIYAQLCSKKKRQHSVLVEYWRVVGRAQTYREVQEQVRELLTGWPGLPAMQGYPRPSHDTSVLLVPCLHNANLPRALKVE